MARQKSGTLALRNYDQVVIFECELKGQLSDGQWENATPYDHWEPWCFADVVVAEDPADVGRDFEVKRDSYGFTRKDFVGGPDLWPDLGERMMGYVRLARHVTGLPVEDVRSVADACGGGTNRLDLYGADTKALVEQLGGLDTVAGYLADESVYNRTQLMADLKDIQAIVKINLNREGLFPEYARQYRASKRRDLIHVGTCRAIRNLNEYNLSSWTLQQVAENQARSYSDDLHDCIKDRKPIYMLMHEIQAKDLEERTRAATLAKREQAAERLAQAQRELAEAEAEVAAL